MSGNTRGGVAVNPKLEWKRFDALPAAIRRVYALAPFDYALSAAERGWKDYRRAGKTVAEFKAREVAWICAHLQKQARKTYGPDHPDAQRSRLERRP
ncbi:MAG: hypothetical protein J0I54_17865 [Bosea sp.]|uniref:hypothetical protein n=1 Tax=unclassified Bosea (in: a-proteobacteria) TaxID=2653178 RepID=UPI00096959C7|nr:MULTISPECIES: hypothetical protein [unclassified Bosea (in: a-proteobacteria)]MBN9458501.1 hypothetical protein [Bosea sp. (in: a-proteobacteria)]OJV06798.1 MAG: hypothetical protein BGO20_00085 [Bosea sp. 67-29]